MPLMKKKLASRNLPSKNISSSSKQETVATPDPPKRGREKPEPEEDNEQEEVQPKKGSWAAAFDSVPLNNNATGVRIGEVYEAVIRKAVLQPPDDKGQSVRMNLELCAPEFVEKGKNGIALWFRITDKDDDPFEGGIKALRITFAKMGLEVESDNLEETLKSITEEMPGVLVKTSSKEGYTNYRIEDLCDSPLIQEYKDNIPY